MLNTKLRRTSLAILAVVLMLSVFAMTAFAEETFANDILMADENANEVLSVDAETAEEDGDLKVDINAASGEEAVTTGSEETADADDHAGHDHDHDEEEAEEKGFTTSDLVLLIIFGVVVIAAVIVCIIKREKVVKFLRSLKSEFKKIVWSPWNQVRKNTIVVIVVVIVLALIIGLLDFLFGHGITELKNLINPAA